ncbi:hypothetical protein HNO52_06465 [Billgrantia diversa]|uniref:hypothetical protein n=1 Tax=Halomonas sp. MCCC 1A13316 TaxID=2733487 RepID=UPI0018A532F1|nr:hypothetical protein [Halomonas sp. MCCC 1A13316]QOR38192.1 hypothetical protein HNO52_06465 [Halomonas sp. MCCC 1A13316]
MAVGPSRPDRLKRMLAAPEFNVALFAFLLNFPWEFLQVPLFVAMPEMAHWDAVLLCTRATLGDVLIALAAFWVVAGLSRNRQWLLCPDACSLLLFIAIGVVITVGLEWHATELQHRWQYAERMPALPLLGTGLVPLLQWVLLPPMILWLARRQILGALYLARHGNLPAAKQ